MTDPTPVTPAVPEPVALDPCPYCRREVDFEHCYREDEHKYPRDFWHVKVSCCTADTGWMCYGEQEQRTVPVDVKRQAEREVAGMWNWKDSASRFRADHDKDTAAQMQALADRLAECEKERDRLGRKCDQLDIEYGDMMDRAATAEAALAEARKVIEPVAASDFRDDEADTTKMPVRIGYLRAQRQWLAANPAKETT